jgi:hypothetical protein
LKKVYYRQGYSEADLFGDTDIQSATISTMPMSTFAPSLSVEMIARLELMRKIYPCDGEIVDHNSFDLIPTPDESGNLVYYEYERYRTIDEVPDMFEEDIIKLVFYYLGEKEAQKALLNPQGNKYNFDRRGNIGAPQSQNDLLQNSRNKQLDDITKSIKTKVMKIG